MATGERAGATGERARRSRSRVARWARGAVLLGATSFLIAPVARADERAGGEVGPTALAARLLEAADTRMKAKLEEARLLEAAGRRDAALAALAEVDKIYERTLELVRPLLVGAAPARQIVVVPSPPLATTPSRSRPSPPRLPFEPAPMVRAPKADPVPGAVAFLLRCQTDDGLFHVSVGRAPGDPEANPAHDGRATAMAILAILDAANPGVCPPGPGG